MNTLQKHIVALVVAVAAIGVVAQVFLITSRSVQDPSDQVDVAHTVVDSGQSNPSWVPRVITSTERIRGNGDEWIDSRYMSTIVFDADQVLSVTEVYGPRGDLETRTIRHRNGSSFRERTLGGDGSITYQSGREWMADVPSIFLDASKLSDAAATDPLARLLSDDYPIAEEADLATLVGQEIISNTEQSAWLGVPVDIYEGTVNKATYGVAKFRVWVSQPDGLKVKLEKHYDEAVLGGELLSTEISSDVPELGVGINTLENLSLDMSLDAPIDFYRSQGFDPTNDEPAPVSFASELWYPNSTPVDGLAIASSSFITGTTITDIEELTGAEFDWCTAIELVDAPRRALVLQGDSDRNLPTGLWFIWPPLWNQAGEVQLAVAGLYGQTVSMDIGNGVTVTGRPIQSSHDQLPVQLDYDMLWTWQIESGLRTVLLTKGFDESRTRSLAYQIRFP